MSPFSPLRSDYPLNLTLLEPPFVRVLKQSYSAGLPSARAITVLLIGSNCLCASRLLVDRAFDAQHYSGANGLNIGKQLVHLVEHWCASPRGNNGPSSYALTLSLLSPSSAPYPVAAVPLLSTSGRHSPITTVLCPALQMRNSTQGAHAGFVTIWRACSWTPGQVRSTQVRST